MMVYKLHFGLNIILNSSRYFNRCICIKPTGSSLSIAMGGSSSRHQRKSTKRLYNILLVVNLPYECRHAKGSVNSPEPTSGTQGSAAADVLEVKINVADLKDGE